MNEARPKSPGASVFGIISLGEMGAALAHLLAAAGVRVVSTSAGRGEQTAARCAAAGVEMLPSVAEVVRRSDVFASVVPPAHAGEVVNAFCDGEPPPRAIFMDVNSVGPQAARSFAAAVARKGRSFVDASINGLAARLGTTATLFLSGPDAERLCPVFGKQMRVRVLGDEPGTASAMKMLLSGVSEGVVALLAELEVLANRQSMRGQFEAALAEIYPEISALGRRMLPTYGLHARRRQTEMHELLATALHEGLRAPAIAGATAFHDLVAEEIARRTSPARPDDTGWLESLVRH